MNKEQPSALWVERAQSRQLSMEDLFLGHAGLALYFKRTLARDGNPGDEFKPYEGDPADILNAAKTSIERIVAQKLDLFKAEVSGVETTHEADECTKALKDELTYIFSLKNKGYDRGEPHRYYNLDTKKYDVSSDVFETNLAVQLKSFQAYVSDYVDKQLAQKLTIRN